VVVVRSEARWSTVVVRWCPFEGRRAVVPIRGSLCGGAHSVVMLSLVVRWCGGHSVVVVQSSPATVVAIQSSPTTVVVVQSSSTTLVQFSRTFKSSRISSVFAPYCNEVLKYFILANVL